MSIERSQSQVFFEKIFTVGSNIPFRQIPKKQIEATSITKQQAEQLRMALRKEARDLYYKAVVSFLEAIDGLEHNSYSWPTIELYYSVFYASKAYINMCGFALLRAERKLFYIKAQPKEKFCRCTNTTDHKATFEILERYFKDDYLLSNQIDGINTYDWIMMKREDVNYKDCIFREPEAPEFWELINSASNDDNIKSVLDKLARDSEGLYIFQPDYAILGIPIKRLVLTANTIKEFFEGPVISESQRKYISKLSSLPDLLNNKIII